ncbi:MAG: CHAT domain-containing tetratricopeptide repeat protein [Bacteroidota bacterium]
MSAQNTFSDRLNTIEKLQSTQAKIDAYQRLLKQQDTLVYTENLGRLYHELGRCYANEKVHDKAILLLKKAIAIRSKLNDRNAYNKSRFRLSRIYASTQAFEKEHAQLISMINDAGDDVYTSYAYRILGRNARIKGDIPQSLQYLNLGLANKNLLKTRKFESNLRYEIITTYAKKYESIFKTDSNYFTDLDIINDHLQRIIIDDLVVSNIPVLYNSLAAVYNVPETLHKALDYYKKAREGFRITGQTYREFAAINNIAIVYSEQGKHELAKKYYDKIVTASDDEEQIATAWNNMGYYLPNTTAKDKIPYFHKAIHTILERNKIAGTNFMLPTLAEVKKSGYHLEILTYLKDLALHQVRAYNDAHDRSYLEQAKEVVYLIDDIISYIRYTSDAEASKLYWIERGVNMYMLAVEVCYLLQDTAAAFYFMEKNKSLLLQENIKLLQQKLQYNIPDIVKQREYALRYETLALQAYLRGEANDSLQQQYALKYKEYQIFKDSIQRLYPQYAKMKANDAIVSLAEVMQKYTEANTIFVEYILHEGKGYGIFYDHKVPVFFKLGTDVHFEANIDSLRTWMTKRMNSKERKEFQTIGFQLFQQLFPFENALERLQDKKIVIVADDILQYIPFEIVPIQTTGKLSDAYLINTTEISYLQSFSLFEQIQKKENKPTKELLVFAPMEFANPALPTLTHASEIFITYATDTTSAYYQKKLATKENFLKNRNDFNIIHLNTHGGLDSISQTPWLAFYDSNMTLYELYGLENQAELVVLDACKTDDGIHLSGEGILNLSRGFFFNGTQSVLASQWKVNEQAGNKILKIFYHELADGKSKSEALQRAKIYYLQNHDQTQTVPYYWATFKLTGSTDAVVQKSWLSVTNVFIGLLTLSCLCVFFFFWKKRFM